MTEKMTTADVIALMNNQPGDINMDQDPFPPSGIYFVEASAARHGASFKDPENPVPYSSVPWTIVAVEGKPKSKMVGQTGSSFFWLDKRGSNDQSSPASIVAKQLYRLFEGKFPDSGKASAELVGKYLDGFDGSKFVVRRVVKRSPKDGKLRARDTLISVGEYKQSRESAEELAGPEDSAADLAAAEAVSKK